MLFSYPLDATTNNWLHESLSEILHVIHDHVRAGNDPPPWPAIIPDAHREQLRSRYGIRNKLTEYTNQLRDLDVPEQDRILNALINQNDIANLLANTNDCDGIDNLPAQIRKPARELFDFAFGLLTDLGIRDNHYQVVYDAMPAHLCPFCGCEYFDAPGAPREAYDHYLAFSHYPLAGANLRNLVPMGGKCNSSYKLDDDVLRNNGGARRRSFDPYGNAFACISLENSEPFEGIDGQLPRWQVDFNPDAEESTTWDDIFHIRERYERDILNPSFFSWLGHFRAWCQSAALEVSTNEELLEALENYIGFIEQMGFSDRAFIKTALFQMLHRHCENGNERLITLLLDLVNSAA